MMMMTNIFKLVCFPKAKPHNLIWIVLEHNFLLLVCINVVQI